VTTKRKPLAPPKPPPSPRFVNLVREIEAFRDYISVELQSLNDQEVSDLTTPLFSVYHLTAREKARRDREGQTAAILQEPRKDWATT
jgi:hypothetical protein